ncbi:MAG: PASTA domain-containing protein [Ferruginibacter sp.]
MFKFLTNRPLWVNILAALLLVFLVIFIFLQFLGVITKHGQHLIVPSVIGKQTTEAIKFLEAKGFEVVIQDSVYTDTADMGIVLKQLPDPNGTVKINRTVFLTVNRFTLPLVDMPSLEGKTLNYGIIILKRSHLKLGDTTYKPDFMRGSILEQSYDGHKVTFGTKVPWGSSIDLVIAGGLTEQRMMVPSLIGLTVAEARTVLEANGIMLGAIIPDLGITDTSAAFVYKQKPPKLTDNMQPVFIQSGQLMDIWISPVMRSLEDSIKPKSIGL